MVSRRPDLVAAGHIVQETIYFTDRTVGPVLGSPPAYSLVTAARLGSRTGLVTKIGDDFPQTLLEPFAQAGVDTSGISHCRQSTLSELIYDADGNKQIRFPSRAQAITARDFPPAYHGCRVVYVCTMQDDIPLEKLADVAALGKESAIDLGGYGGVHMSKQRRSQIRNIRAFALEAAGHFHFVKASDQDCRSIFGDGQAEDFAAMLLAGITKAALITRGDQGVTIVTTEGCWHVPALPGEPIDVTGGGDAFMGGFLSEYIRCGDVLKAAVFGSATALCVIEKTGGVIPSRMPTEDQVRSRIPKDIMRSVVTV
ncbi:MAG: hypothetical protein GWP14_10735 [Actinobacteria bacterium]|nr:hypothetical protein [Actinomycetota bacterium]